ncbi:MAG: xylose isomerase [Acholeplasmatales bacterium]|nr:xylose isomerase [Acholeplasmatales bacterium]
MKYFNFGKIKYEGPLSKNPYSFKEYNKDEIIMGKKMEEHLRFAVSWWHTLTALGSDPFGSNSMTRKWITTDPISTAMCKIDAGFEFMQKLGIKYFCFHDRDLVEEGETLEESNKRLDIVSDYLLEKMKETGIKCLWGTANLFNNKRFVHGASTSPNADVFAYSCAQVKKAIEITNKLGGENYVFWGGREGYETLLNTDTERELNHFALFLKMAKDYANKIGFKGQFLIEPKPKEPTKHQYDFDTQTVLSFLRKYGLEKDFKVNIEANHATLAGHTFNHELNMARINGVLGSIDANKGDLLLGWDTDQFPTDVYDATLCMYEVLKNGGLNPGGLNFDAKVRRSSFELDDLAFAYISGMDTFAKGLKVASKLLEDKVFEDNIKERYKSYESGIGKKIDLGQVDFEMLNDYALKLKEIDNVSGHQELLETILNQYIYNTK